MDKLPTPLWNLNEFTDEVYEPREDTFLLMDALETDLNLIKKSNAMVALEIGSGSGVVITSLSLAVPNLYCLALDINPKACVATKNTAALNKTQVDVIRSDLVKSLRLNKSVDLLIFNPPYVPSDGSDENSILDKAWAGLERGRSTIDWLLPILEELMSNTCLGYFVAIDENNPEEILSILRSKGFNSETVARRKIIGEKLSILRFSRGLDL
ncbi:hemK methyltransferase family member 2 isoform X1 [Cimex lectularius]|uniref:Methyltransferase HEMK2 n=1 Tax=Cimex lectularius TaxID=79782 RepID=A0A8I6RSD7_CIMLE|nr:hemK methyltransferase family member 2 isoform X1 [Cimex lectularius]